jgi:hypothetical protein
MSIYTIPLTSGPHRWRRRQATSSVIILRYADIVVGIQRYRDAQAFFAQLRERDAKFSLTLHAAKTRLIEFGRFARTDRVRRGGVSPKRSPFSALPTSARKMRLNTSFPFAAIDAIACD